MRFNEYRDGYLSHKRYLPKETTPELYFAAQMASSSHKPGDFNQLIMEREWVRAGRPYYNLYPKIIPHLFKVKEEKVPVESVKLPLKTLLLKFPENCEDLSFEFSGQSYYLRTALVGQYLDASFRPKDVESILVYMDVGEIVDGSLIYTYQRIPLVPGTTIGQAVSNLPSDMFGVIAPRWFFDKILRMICTICMLSKNIDDAIVIPDLINSDKKKLDSASNSDLDRLHAKAIRNGKYGWNVGERMMVAPHVRSGTPLALYWTGKGRTQMTYRPRKGCVVHRKIVNTLPTGFQPEPDLVPESTE